MELSVSHGTGHREVRWDRVAAIRLDGGTAAAAMLGLEPAAGDAATDGLGAPVDLPAEGRVRLSD